MSFIDGQTELLNALRGDSGKDLLSALPLVSSHIESTTILGVLRSSIVDIGNGAQDKIGLRVCIIAFGSLGRLEYVSSASDLDPIIVVDGEVSADLAATVRSTILTPLAQMNPWLTLDHRTEVLRSNWTAITSPEIPYPVVGTTDLIRSENSLIGQRRWQILLEGRPIFNDPLFNSTYDSLLPTLPAAPTLIEDELATARPEIDFERLAEEGVVFFGGFDNPVFLYKTPFKYFKTRFLRDFFVFASQLNFVLGRYLLLSGQELSPRYARAATVTKMMRAVQFAHELDRACKQDPMLAASCEHEIDQILRDHQLQRQPILLFGAHYATVPGRLLHGLLMSVLSRFSACWEKIYDLNVRGTLETLPNNLNFESAFPPQVKDPSAKRVLEELTKRRDSYRRYMAATALSMRKLFGHGRVWNGTAVPYWVGSALTAFEKR